MIYFCFSVAITVIAVFVIFMWPAFAFNYLMSIALFAGILNWIMVLITQMLFRKKIGPEAEKGLTFKLPFYPVINYVVIAFLLFVVVMMAFSPGYRPALIVGPIWLVVLLVAYQIKKAGAKKNPVEVSTPAASAA